MAARSRSRFAAATQECASCERWNAKTDCDCSTCFLTPEQAELNVLPSRPQRHTLVYGNARSGKAVPFVRAIAQRALHVPGSRTRCFGCALY